MLHEGEKYMRERLHLFESAGIVNIDYADAIIGLANWMDIYNQDYIAALEWHKNMSRSSQLSAIIGMTPNYKQP